VAATGIAAATRSGWRVAHSSAWNPPIEPPIAISLVIPSRSASMRWLATMSAIVISGKRMP
jgi:hypothetical protein